MAIFHLSQTGTTMCLVAHFGVMLNIVSIIDESTLWSRTSTFENWDYEYSRTGRIPNQRKSTYLVWYRIYNYQIGTRFLVNMILNLANCKSSRDHTSQLVEIEVRKPLSQRTRSTAASYKNICHIGYLASRPDKEDDCLGN